MKHKKNFYRQAAGAALVFVLALVPQLSADTLFGGKTEPGFQQVEGLKYPVYAFVPKGYRTDRPMPAVLVIPGERESAQELIKEWAEFNRLKSYMVFVPDLPARTEDLPYRNDAWVKKLRKELVSRFAVIEERFFLVGRGTAAHYTGYFGVKHPQQFGGVGMLGGSFDGPFRKLIRLSSRPGKQVPLYMVVDAKQFERAQETAYNLTKKGYPLSMETLKEGESLKAKELKVRVIEWLEKKSAGWALQVKESQKKLEEKMKKGVEEFFQTPS